MEDPGTVQSIEVLPLATGRLAQGLSDFWYFTGHYSRTWLFLVAAVKNELLGVELSF